MSSNKNIQNKPKKKTLHPRNQHNKGYDFLILMETFPSLRSYVRENKYGNLSIDFADSKAVKALNCALLMYYYDITNWDIPDGALCPPIPGRVDYIHYVADKLLGVSDSRLGSSDNKAVQLLDIGTGASGIYSILASQIYGWHCVGTDINEQSLANVEGIIASNQRLRGRVSVRRQKDKSNIFTGIILDQEFFDISVCNPPFHCSEEEALKGSQRKLTNLSRNRGERNPNIKSCPSLNFGGMGAELWCNGGERLFLKKMAKESLLFATQCRWFTSLVSKVDNVKPIMKQLRKLGALEVREIEMVQGNKITRIVAWTYMQDA